MKNVKRIFNFLSLIVLSLLVLTTCIQQPKDATELMKNNAPKFMEAYNNGDANAVAMLYTTNAKLFPENGEALEGRDAVEAFWNGAMAMGIAKLDISAEAAKSVGGLAVEEGIYKSFTNDDQMIDQGKYISVLTKENGEWRIDEHIWNSSIPEPAIMGAWKMVEVKNVVDGNVAYSYPNGNVDARQVKIWSRGHFSFVGTFKADNQTSVNYGDGTYSFEGDIYTENIEFHVSEPLIGTSMKMKVVVNENTLTQIYPVDDDGNYDENNYTFEKYMRLD